MPESPLLFSSLDPACGSCFQLQSQSRGSAEVRVLSVPPRFFAPADAHATGMRVRPKGRGGSQTAATSALPESGEQSQNVYENKGRVQKSLVAQTAGSAVCGFSVIRWGGPRTANTAVRATA
jgi:hypothetical protein